MHSRLAATRKALGFAKPIGLARPTRHFSPTATAFLSTGNPSNTNSGILDKETQSSSRRPTHKMRLLSTLLAASEAITTRLSNAALPELAANGVSIPTYDRSQVSGGILHVGVGNFHRAHMGAYIDDILEKDFDRSKEWGIVGCGMFDASKRDTLEPQDWLQTLVEHDATSAKARILGCMVDYLPVDINAIEEKMQDPSIKMVSLTVTEGGYYLDDGKLDMKDPQIKHDIANPDKPETVFGCMVKALKYRRDNGLGPFSVLSCDNIVSNGDVVKSVVVGLAKAQKQDDLVDWIEKNVGFPNGMVDRITPALSDEKIEFVIDHWGFEDEFPVFCEPFTQWVLEDKFGAAGRPPLELCDTVTFTDNVAPYEFMKIRILNGGHASLCYPSALLGLNYVHEAMEHPTIGKFLHCLEKAELIPTVPPVPDTDLQEYWKTIQHRFSNPTLADTIPRNCFGGSGRQPKFIVPVAKDNLKAGSSVDGLALVSAMWCRYCQGTTEAGEIIEPNDPKWDKLNDLAMKAKTSPTAWLDMHDVYGDVGQDPVFVEAFSKALESVQKNGVEAAMKDYIESKRWVTRNDK